MITKTKLVKRIFSSLLTAALAVPMTALTAHATGEAFFYPPKNPVMTDQQFEVSVTFSADSEIGSVQANIAYDDSVIEFVSSDNASGGGGVLTVNGFPDTPSSEVDFSFLLFVNGHRRTGMKKVMNMMRSETICWAGILQIMALENSMR